MLHSFITFELARHRLNALWPNQKRYQHLYFAGRIAWICLMAAGFLLPEPVFAQDPSFDWRTDWALMKGFTMTVDTTGYYLPSAIAFVPHPGPKPEDPLYFVTEVRGTIKVVSNDRTVHTFAEGFLKLHPLEELPSGKGQVGLAGLCLAPAQGYLFATFAYQDDAGILRNDIIRFTTKPDTFALQPVAQKTFTDIFLPYESGLAHHIGPCQVHNDQLYVSVGEAWQPHRAQDLSTMHGKLIRMTLDGDPVPDNPFYVDSDRQKAANYVWAYGLRNPFGLKMVGDRIFAADNGQNIDRFLELHQGENYLWNGNDKTIAANAAFVFVPSIAPVQMDSYPTNASFFPAAYEGYFFVASSAFDKATNKISGIFAFKYDLTATKMVKLPEYFVKYRGDEYQAVTGLAFGPDGLYFTQLMPNAAGETPIFKVTYQPEAAYPYTTIQITDPMALFVEKGCAGCHAIGTRWGYGSNVGPNLEKVALTQRLQERLNHPAYLNVLDEMDKIEAEPQSLWKAARQEVRTATGVERVHTWVKYHIMEPRFDTLYSAMPTLAITDDEATILSNFLVDLRSPRLFSLSRLLPQRLRPYHMVVAFLAGALSTSVAVGVFWLVGKGRQRRRRALSGTDSTTDSVAQHQGATTS